MKIDELNSIKAIQTIITNFWNENKNNRFNFIVNDEYKEWLSFLDRQLMICRNDLDFLFNIREVCTKDGYNKINSFLMHVRFLAWQDFVITMSAIFEKKTGEDNQSNAKIGIKKILEKIGGNKELEKICSELKIALDNNKTLKDISETRNKTVHYYIDHTKGILLPNVSIENLYAFYDIANTLILFIKWIGGVRNDCVFIRQYSKDNFSLDIFEFAINKSKKTYP